MNPKTFRPNGAIGALLDEYEKALRELIEVIRALSPEELQQVVDSTTKDTDCQSIQSILTHVVQSGYTYVIIIRKHLGETIEYKEKIFLNSASDYQTALQEMFAFNEALFEDYPNLRLVEHLPEKKITARWGQQYDVDQLFEHAIVHVLRHRRQIERFKLTILS